MYKKPKSKPRGKVTQKLALLKPVRKEYDTELNLLDELLEGSPFFQTFLTPFGVGIEDEWPQVKITESVKDYTVTIAAQGVDSKSVKVEYFNNIVSIRGEKRKGSVERDDKGNCIRSECSYGAFSRMFTLPCGVQQQRIRTTIVNGVLKIVLPKTMNGRSGSRNTIIDN
ncbi:MAG: Hsp20/alpha crystallin family protein [Elusimicrobiota bacterium]